MSEILTYNGIHYRLLGSEGPWVVFFHGFCERMTLWDSVIPDERKYRILIPDLPGFGLSVNTTIRSLSDMGRQVTELLEYLRVKNPILFGHSMGGYLAAEMIRTGMLQVSGLGMVHSTFHADSEEKKQNRDKTIHFLHEQPLSAFLSLFTEGLFAIQNTGNKDFIKKAEQLVSLNATRSVQNALEAMKNRKESLNWLKETETPVLFITGRYDRHVPIEVTLSEVALCRRGMIQILENSGHIGQIEEPETMKIMIARFMEWVADLQD